MPALAKRGGGSGSDANEGGAKRQEAVRGGGGEGGEGEIDNRTKAISVVFLALFAVVALFPSSGGSNIRSSAVPLASQSSITRSGDSLVSKLEDQAQHSWDMEVEKHTKLLRCSDKKGKGELTKCFYDLVQSEGYFVEQAFAPKAACAKVRECEERKTRAERKERKIRVSARSKATMLPTQPPFLTRRCRFLVAV